MAKNKGKAKKENSPKQLPKSKPSFYISERMQDFIFLGIITLILLILLKPLVIDGLSPQGVDVVASKGKSHQIVEYNKSHKDLALWNPFIFAGMPEYQNYGPMAYSVDNILGIIVLNISMIDSIVMYRQVIPALYLPLVMPAQIFGYGMGFIYNFIRRIIFSKGEKVGFKKHYYK